MRKDIALVVLLISILALMVIPMPTGLIDILLVVSISLSVVLLMVAVYIKRPSDFSTFPAVILIATVFRLSLSIATTRLILSEADAGQIIATFGEFVVRGSVVIGLVMFLIITVVQFIVVTKGSERVAEVAARFTLDALPGKQMSIEADIRAGTLEQEEGSSKRKALDKDSQFFGAMDGAMKFVKGDAIAGLIIIFINLIGGVAVGVGVHSLSLGEAATVYSLLTIGDGLVAQIPALLMSICAGVIVTRVANENPEDLGTDIAKELMSDSRVPAAASVIIFLFGFVPGFPFPVFAIASVSLFVAALLIKTALRKAAEAKEAEAAEAAAEAGAQPVDDGVRRSDRIGVALSEAGAEKMDMQALVAEVTRRVEFHSKRYGVTFARPFIKVHDLATEDAVFQIELDEVAVETGEIPSDSIVTDATLDQLRSLGIEDDIPVIDWIVSSNPRRFVPQSFQAKLEEAGLMAASVEKTLAESIFRRLENAVRVLFSNQECEELVAAASKLDEATVSFVTEKQSPQNLIRIFRYLLEDGIPLRPRRLLFESLAHWLHLHPEADAVFLAECMRNSLKRQLCHNLANSQGELAVSMISPALEERILNDIRHIKSLEQGAEIDNLPLDAEMSDFVVGEARKLQELDTAPDRRVAIVTAPNMRRRLRNFLAQGGINVPIISPHEISEDIMTLPIAVFGEAFKGAKMSDVSREARVGALFKNKSDPTASEVPA